MMSDTVLALDLATVTGFALRGGEGKVKSGRVRLPAPDPERLGKRLHEFRNWLTDMKGRAGGIDHVIWEDAFRQPGKAGEFFGNIVGVLLDWCEHHNITYSTVNASTLKKFATGHGHASKDQMVGAARRLGFDVIDDNEADAIHILRYHLAQGN